MNWKNRWKTIAVSLIGGSVLGILLLLLLPYIPSHFSSSASEVPKSIALRLTTLGRAALLSRDVPVASVLLYRDSIIGEGFNTVRRVGNAGGHAEINAISDALQRVGPVMFSALNRDSLILISTFEPCPMCRGAILEHHINHVRFLKPKPLSYLVREELRSIRYRWTWKQMDPAALQDSLFRSHPDYTPER